MVFLNNSKLRKFFIYTAIFLISLCILLASILLRHYEIIFLSLYGLPLSFLILSIAYFVLTVILLKKYRGELSTFGILFSIILAFIDIPLRIIDFRETLVSFPELIGRLSAVAMGYIYVRQSQNRNKILIASLTFGFIIMFSFGGYKYFGNYLNFGTFTGKTKEVISNPLLFEDNTGNNISLSQFTGSYLMLDFWSTGCAACHRQFPEVQRISQNSTKISEVNFYSVFCRIKDRGETPQLGLDILKRAGYDFPFLSVDIEDPLLKEMGVIAFPTVIIFDPDSKLIFRGSIEYAEKYLQKLIGL